MQTTNSEAVNEQTVLIGDVLFFFGKPRRVYDIVRTNMRTFFILEDIDKLTGDRMSFEVEKGWDVYLVS